MFPSSEGVRVANTQKTSHALSFFAGLSGFGVTRMLFWAIVIIEGENHVAVKKDATPSTPPLRNRQNAPNSRCVGSPLCSPPFPILCLRAICLSFSLGPHFSLFCFTLSVFFFSNEFSLFFLPPPLPLNFGE